MLEATDVASAAGDSHQPISTVVGPTPADEVGPKPADDVGHKPTDAAGPARINPTPTKRRRRRSPPTPLSHQQEEEIMENNQPLAGVPLATIYNLSVPSNSSSSSLGWACCMFSMFATSFPQKLCSCLRARSIALNIIRTILLNATPTHKRTN